VLAALFAVTVLDELASGVTPSASPDIARDFAIGAGAAAGIGVAAFHVVSVVLEPALLAAIARARPRIVSSLALLAIATTMAIAALAPSAMVLWAALSFFGLASGCALTASEGVLVERAPDAREQTLARLSLAGAIGDLAVPLLLAALAWIGAGWRDALLVIALAALALSVVHARAHPLDARSLERDDGDGGDGDDADDDEDDVPLAAVLRDALRNRPLIAWIAAAALTNLLDEILIAFAAIHLEAHLGADVTERSVVLGAGLAGSIVGLALLDRLLARREPIALLRSAALLAIPALVALVLAPTIATATAAMFVLGAAAAALHPIAEAQAYASLPGRPGIVNAVASLAGPLDLAAPLVLAWVAQGAGSAAALLLLGAAPAIIALFARRRPPRSPDG
jgi:MFS family permease